MFQQCLLSTALGTRSLGGGEGAAAAAGRNVKQNESQITAASSEGKVIRARAREVKNELIESTRLSGEAESEGCRR